MLRSRSFWLKVLYDAPFMLFDVTRYKGRYFFVGEPWDLSPYFEGGRGPTLWYADAYDELPKPVPESRKYRFYAITVFRDELLALGCYTRDILKPGLESAYSPIPPLYLFASRDGLKWYVACELGDIESGGVEDEDWVDRWTVGNILMEGNRQFTHAVHDGIPVVYVTTGHCLVRWDGVRHVVYSFPTAIGNCAVWGGKVYVAVDRTGEVVVSEGVVLFYYNTSGMSDSLYVTQASYGDPPVSMIGGGEPLIRTVNGEIIGVRRAWGWWIFFVNPYRQSELNGELPQRFGYIRMRRLPPYPITIDVYAAARQVIEAPKGRMWMELIGDYADATVMKPLRNVMFIGQRNDFQTEFDKNERARPIFAIINPFSSLCIDMCELSWQDCLAARLDKACIEWSEGDGVDSPLIDDIAVAYNTTAAGTSPIINTASITYSDIAQVKVDKVKLSWQEIDFPAVDAISVSYSLGDGEASPQVASASVAYSDGTGQSPAISSATLTYTYKHSSPAVDGVMVDWIERFAPVEGRVLVLRYVAKDWFDAFRIVVPEDLERCGNIAVAYRVNDDDLPPDDWDTYHVCRFNKNIDIRGIYGEDVRGKVLRIAINLPEGIAIGGVAVQLSQRQEP